MTDLWHTGPMWQLVAEATARLEAARCNDEEPVAAVKQATAQELAKGWLTGPLTPEEVTAEVGGRCWTPSRRFGVRQGAKLRRTDDVS